PMLKPSRVKRGSPSKRVYAPKCPSSQRASRALSTNQPSPEGSSPPSVAFIWASGTMAPLLRRRHNACCEKDRRGGTRAWRLHRWLRGYPALGRRARRQHRPEVHERAGGRLLLEG